ncbi:MAG: YceH family protein [Trueperaceae bacterium]|nr:MAG: YceH family protein [Trueperaceae bacterium]
MSLREIEIRILGSLVEKERTTPENYPLSTNALVLACNQKTNRDPVTSYSQIEIEEALRNLHDKGLTSTVRGVAERVFKHSHMLQESLDIGQKEFAVLAVLMLRGPQTPGELRTRTERYVFFRDISEVEASLQRLEGHRPPLTRNLGRAPGQSQDRWVHTLGPSSDMRPRVRATQQGQVPKGDAVAELRHEIDQMRADIDRIMDHLGLDLDNPVGEP